MAEHQWTGEGKDRIRTCRNEGCAVRRRRRGFAHEEWQAAKGHHWRPIPKAGAHCAVPIPPCKGTPPAARCTHVERIPLALGPGQTVVGGLKAGQCERRALSRLVVCEQHAEPEAIRLLVLAMVAEIEHLKQLPGAGRDN